MKPVQEITTEDVRRVLRAVEAPVRLDGAKIVQVMREGFAVAIREDALVRSPLEKLDPRELPKPGSTKRPRRLDRPNSRSCSPRQGEDAGYHALFVLLAFTGLRIREALALTWATSTSTRACSG